VVGHALGAVVALVWALRNPDRSDRVMAVSMPVTGGAINQRLATPEALTLFDKAFIHPPANFEALQLETRKADEAAIVDSLHSVMGLDMLGELGRMTLPVLLVYGDQDDIVTPLDSSSLSGSEFVRGIYMPESRHFPMLDECTKFSRLLRDFLVAEDVNSLSLKEEWRRITR
jgi:pimeloyl-ACP methyl ester carboxylesterase